MKAVLRIALLAALSLAAGLPAGAQEKSWVGEWVMYTKPHKEIQFGDVVDGKQIYFPFSGIMPIKVRDEREGLMRIHDGRREGWVDKADFVLVRDASAYFHRRVQANPKDTYALWMRGSGWWQKGEPDNAIKDFNEFIRLDPTVSAAFNARGTAWYVKTDYDKAIADYNEAIRLDPEYAIAYNNRGAAWSDKKDYDKAIGDYNEAIRLNPEYVLAYNSRGNAWTRKNDYDKTIADYSEAIRLDPKFERAYNGLARLWATCPEAKYRFGKKAVESAKQALKLGPKSANHMDTLAAAYAESGDFAEAVRWQEKALEDPGFKNDPDMRRRLELYRDKKPYRQE